MEETHDVIVIGAGQAGLATGYWLARAGLDYVILDAHRRIGDGWRGCWDSLRLFSPASANHLPGMEFPGDPRSLPTKDAVADYLEAYAARFQLAVRGGQRVHRVRRIGRRFEVDTTSGRCVAAHVVVATGAHAATVVPAWASDLDASIVQCTARAYRNPGQLPAGPTLVVGAGNSGVQIGMELAATRPTWVAGRDTGTLPRRVLHHDIAFWAERLGVMQLDVDSVIGRAIVARVGHRGFPVVGISAAAIAASGARRVPRAEGAEAGRPRLSDGRVLAVRAVVWCTGLVPDFSFVEGLSTDAHGNPRHTRGRSTQIDGLFFAGLRFQSRLGSDLLGGVGRDAEQTVRAIVTSRVEDRNTRAA